MIDGETHTATMNCPTCSQEIDLCDYLFQGSFKLYGYELHELRKMIIEYESRHIGNGPSPTEDAGVTRIGSK